MKLIALPTSNIKLLLICVLLAGTMFSCQQHTQAEQQEKKSAPSPEDKLPIDVKFVELKNGAGWEYDIYVDHKLYIKQDRIPAISGIHGFATKADAEKTAHLVIQKIKEGQIPALSEQELKDLQIQLPTQQ
ncbi:DUF4907 domain-containing protein [Filimonas effusa]|nr:DUF4907 domain-containing protein [Filimonas effusa]